MILLATFCDELNYVFVIQDNRGRFASEGIDSCFWDDGWGTKQDGYDTIEWIAKQSFSNGKIGMYGASACGIVQLLATGAYTPHLTCMIPEVAAYDFYNYTVFQGGEFRYSMIYDWLNGQGSVWMWDFWRSHPNYDDTWKKMDLRTRLSGVKTPGLHIGGFIDIFTDATINACFDLQNYGGEGAKDRQRMIMGWWSHPNYNSREQGDITLPPNGTYDLGGVMIKWYAYHLRNSENGVMDMPVMTYYLLGDVDRYPSSPGNDWYSTDKWPPDSTVLEKWYLSSDGLLLRNQKPDGGTPYREFKYDPKNPVPTNGGRNLTRNWGIKDQREQENRSDVLVYQSEILQEPVIVTGPVIAHLQASSNCKDTDFTVKITDVYPDGRSLLMADGILMGRHYKRMDGEDLLEEGRIYEMKVDLWSIAVAFDKGHRIRIAVSSSNYPRFETNPNTGETFGKNTYTKTATNRVYNTDGYFSYLSLPVMNGTKGFNEGMSRRAIPKPLFDVTSYPNPCRNYVEFRVLSGFDGSNLRFVFYDISGRKVLEQHIKTISGLREEKKRIDISKLKPGRFTVLVSTSKKSKAIGIVKIE